VKVLDFGLAKYEPKPSDQLETWSRSGAQELPGTLAGTIAYMSPEQALGRDVDGRSDVFSLGIVLYELLAGRRPFDGANPMETFHAILHEPPPPLDEVPPALQRVVLRMLEKERARRYPDMDAVHRDLEAVTRGSAPEGAAASDAPSVAVVRFQNIT